VDSYYHIYNRGVNKRRIFLDKEDYVVFLNLLKRHLSGKPQEDLKGREYIWLYEDMELLAFCLMPNHFHLCIYQHTPTAMQRLLGAVSMSYTTYFNKKYQRIGPLFQDTYKASHILDDSYVQHITRYIHLNPKGYKEWEFSSLPYFLGKKQAEWIRPEKILDMFGGRKQYGQFVEDYADYKATLATMGSNLANR
jgi:putative transposase